MPRAGRAVHPQHHRQRQVCPSADCYIVQRIRRLVRVLVVGRIAAKPQLTSVLQGSNPPPAFHIPDDGLTGLEGVDVLHRDLDLTLP